MWVLVHVFSLYQRFLMSIHKQTLTVKAVSKTRTLFKCFQEAFIFQVTPHTFKVLKIK